MEDNKQWQVDHFNLKQRPRKFKPLVANRAAEEYQADFSFFDSLRHRENVEDGDATITVI